MVVNLENLFLFCNKCLGSSRPVLTGLSPNIFDNKCLSKSSMGFMTSKKGPSKKAVSFVLIVCFNVNERIEKQKQNCVHGTKRREGLFCSFYYAQGRYKKEAIIRPKKIIG